MNKEQKKKLKQDYLDNKFDKRTKEDFMREFKDSIEDYVYYLKRKKSKN
jgi:hypothetical protein